MFYNLVYAGTALVDVLFIFPLPGRRVIYYLFLLFFFALSAFRFEVGCDYYSYYNHTVAFSDMTYGEALVFTEPGYWLTTVVLRDLGVSFPGINVVASIMFFLGVNALAQRQPNPLLFLSLLFPILITGIAMSAVRQSMAMGVVFFAFNAFADRKLIKYVSLVVIAAQFHQSAYILAVLAPFAIQLSTLQKLLALIFATVPAVYLASRTSAAEQYASLYVNTQYDAFGGIFRVSSVAVTSCVFILYYRTRWKKYFPSDFNLVEVFSFAGVALFPTVLFSSVIGDRLNYYVMVISTIVLSRFYFISKRNYLVPMFLGPILLLGMELLFWSQLSWIFTACYGTYRTWLF